MKTFGILAVVGMAAAANAQVGSPQDMYVMGDGSSEVYQVTKWAGFNNSGNHINNPMWAGNGSAASLPAGYHPFSPSGAQGTQSNSPYLASFGGARNNFYVSGFGGTVEVDGNTGAYVQRFTNGFSLDNEVSANGNDMWVADSNGTSLYNSAAVYQGVSLAGVGAGGGSLMTSNGNDLYVSGWNSTSIVKYTGPNVNSMTVDLAWGVNGVMQTTGGPIQKLDFDSFGNLYYSTLYGAIANNGLYRVNAAGTSDAQVCNALVAETAFPGEMVTGWHGFEFGPDGNIYFAGQYGDVWVYRADGTFLGKLIDIDTKLTDVNFKPVPTPGVLSVLGLGALAARRRRR